jgi:DNA-binding MarR family transcriptional regulator
MIDVSPADFLKLYGGMVRVLQAIEKAGPGAGLPSRRLGEQVLGSRSHGWKVLRQAEEIGYITRRKVSKPEGKGGHYYVMNYLTPKGRKLLRELEEEEEGQ